MKTKIFLGSVIVILLTAIGLLIGFNWDVFSAKIKNEDLYTEAQIEEIQKQQIQQIDKKELISYTWEIAPKIEGIDAGKMVLKFKENGEVDITTYISGDSSSVTFNYEILKGIVYIMGETDGHSQFLMLIKQNDIINAGTDSEHMYVMEKQVTNPTYVL